MPRQALFLVVLGPLVLTVLVGSISAQTKEESTVRTATAVMNEIMAIPARGIPQSLLAVAEGIAIIPDVVKIGFIGGVRHGKGVLLIRSENGAWNAPIFVTLTGGSIGWQVGVQATDAVLVFTTKRSVEGLTGGKFTIGVDAAAAAGPVGRKAGAATDAQLRAEILTYSRSRGLFAGVSIDGSALQINSAANAVYYNGAAITTIPAAAGQGVVPNSAMELLRTVALYTPPPSGPVAQVPAGAAVSSLGPLTSARPIPDSPNLASASADGLRQQLVDSAGKLHVVLDDHWRQFLALPSEVVAGTAAPSAEGLSLCLANYDRVARDVQYRALAVRPEFQTTYGLLRTYAANLSNPQPGAMTLPPPPVHSQSRLNTRQRY